MTIPNVGVSGVIQDPGLGGVLAKGIGGITQLLMQQQQMADQRAKDQVAANYTNQLTADLKRKGTLEEEQRLAAQQQLAQQKTAYEALLETVRPQLNDGQYASLRIADPAAGAAYIQKLMFPEVTKFAEGERGVVVGPNGVAKTVVQAGAPLPKMADMPTDLREAIGVVLRRDPRNPEAFMAPLSPDEAQRVNQYINHKVATGANRSSVTIAGDSFAKGLGDAAAARIGRTEQAASDAATDLQTIGELNKLLNDGVILGAGQKGMEAIGNVLVQLGVGGDEIADPVARTQAYAALVGARVGKVITMFGSGTGLSDADREYATAIAGGKMNMTPPALKRILKIAEKQNRWVIKQHTDAVERLPVGEDIKGALRVSAPPEDKPELKMFQQPDGSVVQGRLDPKTGRYVGVVNGKSGYVDGGGP